MRKLVLLVALWFTPVLAQSVWLETGLGYAERALSEDTSEYTPYLKLGLRGVFPVSERVGLYVAPFWLGGVGIDAGAWFTFPTDLNDLEGFRAYAGTGLSLAPEGFGLALSAGLAYELNRNLDLTVSYTHRPLLRPKLSQTFDFSVGLALRLE